MAGTNQEQQILELRDLRAWRALVIEARGVIRSLESLRFVLGLPLDDALAAFGLGGSAWARERWQELRAALDAPVEEPARPARAVPEAA